MYITIRQRRIDYVLVFTYTIFGILVIKSFQPYKSAVHYAYIKKDDIQHSLVEQITRNISLQQLPACSYDDIINSNTFYYLPMHTNKVLRREEILPGGEYYPTECRARFSVAIIVPFRKREAQLHQFLIYMHNYLREQRIHYRIFIIEQFDDKPFNRAKLFNVGAVVAAQYGFPCLVLQDVDLLPLNAGQMHVCTKLPRHMCAALDAFRYNLPYSELFGGAVAIQTEQFRAVNGMSNMYNGWGGEDDDFYLRIIAHRYSICRFAPSYNEYTMMKHKQEVKNEQRNVLLKDAELRLYVDGLNSLEYEEVERRMHSLFTHIIVRL